jgi:replicative DNA helicase
MSLRLRKPKAGRSKTKDWPAPRPLETPSLPQFPTDALPGWLRSWVEAQTEALQVPSDLPALLSLAVLATASAKRFEVKIRPGWIEPVNLYLLVALASGTRKSVVFEAATAPIVEYEAELERRVTPMILPEEYEEKIAPESRLRLVDANTGGKRRERRQVEPGDDEPRESTRIFASDATPERTAALLAENAGRMAILSDEGEICSIIAGRYGGSFEIFLKAHSGQVVSIERQGRKRVHVRRPALTLGLAVQPDVLHALSAKRAVRERGLLARFLVAVPASNVGYRAIASPPVPDRVMKTYETTIRALLEEKDGQRGDELVPTTLTLSPEAHRVFVSFEGEIEAMLRPEGALGGISSWGSKLPGVVARLAGLLFRAKHAAETPHEIDATTMKNAIAIGRYAIPHALTAFVKAGADADLGPAKVVLEWLGRSGKSEVTKRDLHQALRSHFPRAKDLEVPLDVLEEHGFLRRDARKATRGRPSQRYEVHPRLVRSPSNV